MPEQTIETWINVKFTDQNLVADLDEMVEEDGTDRSKFMRQLVRKEKARRQQMAMPLETATARKSGARRVAAPA